METTTTTPSRQFTGAPLHEPTTPTTTPAFAALKDITSGSLAGIAGKVIEYPFDTIKVRLQSQPDHLPLRYTGPLDCFRQSVRADGIRGLYRGVSAPFAGAAAETACLFFSYRVAQNLLLEWRGQKEGPLGLGALVTAGGMSGAVTSVVLTPIELVKCRMQVPVEGELRMRAVGPLVLGTFFRETGGTAAWFGSYEATTLFFKDRIRARSASASESSSTTAEAVTLPMPQQLLSGAIAGMAYNFLFFPADTIKSQMQTGELTATRPTFMGVGKALWRGHGLKGLYRGCGITVARSAPSSALIFAIVEQLKILFG